MRWRRRSSTADKRRQQNELLREMGKAEAGGFRRLLSSYGDFEFERASANQETMIRQHEELFSQLQDAFELAAEGFVIEPIDGRLSVLSRPLVKRAKVYAERWAIYVPPEQRVSLHVDYEKLNPRAGKEFVQQKPITVQLESGLHDVRATFWYHEETPAALEIELNGSVIVTDERTEAVQKSRAHRVIDFKRQKNFDVGDTVSMLRCWAGSQQTQVHLFLNKGDL